MSVIKTILEDIETQQIIQCGRVKLKSAEILPRKVLEWLPVEKKKTRIMDKMY